MLDVHHIISVLKKGHHVYGVTELVCLWPGLSKLRSAFRYGIGLGLKDVLAHENCDAALMIT